MIGQVSLRTKLTVGFGVLMLALTANSLVGYFSAADLGATTALMAQVLQMSRLMSSEGFKGVFPATA